MELKQADSIAAKLVELLSPYCSKIEVAGSVRRRKAFVNDIDIVLIASDPWGMESQLRHLQAVASGKGRTALDGHKLKRFMFGGAQVDLYIATEQTWATLLLIRTGSKENNIRLATIAKKRGWHLSANGDGLFDESGKRIAGDSEGSIFYALGLEYPAPEKR